MQKKKTFNSIYIWRIIFTLMILIFHFDNIFGIWSFLGLTGRFGWYIAVEFFFIVSGFLVYKRAKSAENTVPAHIYLWERVRKIWPPYIAAYILTFATIIICRNDVNGIVSTYEHFIDNFLEVFMLQGIGLGRGWDYVNPIAWYISILVICSYFIYYLIVNHSEAFENLIAPIITIVCFSWLYRNHGCLDATISSMSGFYANGALMRGLADMCLGIYAAKFSSYIENKIANNAIPYGQKGILAIKISGILCFLYVIVFSIQYGYSHADFAYVLLLFYAVAIGFIPCQKCGIGDNGEYTKGAKIILYFSRISLHQYLLHQMYRDWIFPILFPNRAEFPLSTRIFLLFVYLIVVTISAMLLYFGISKIVKHKSH